MKLLKPAPAKYNPADNIDINTSRYTRPLVFKVIGTFAVMVLLLIILTIFALGNLNQGKDSSHQALDIQTKANIFQRLRESIVSERVSVLNSLYTGLADPNLKTYQANFDEEELNLLGRGSETYSLVTIHDQLRVLYANLLEASNQGRPADAQAMWKSATVPAQNLLQLVDARLNQANAEALKAARTADEVENNAASSTLWLALIAFLIIAGLILFVFGSVIGPLRLLNQNLAHLLWTQTEHLTDQLNVVQAEIIMNNEMLTAVRHDLKAPLSSIKGLAELSLILQSELEPDVSNNLGKIIEMADISVSTISDMLTRREQKLDLQVVNIELLVDKVLQLVDLRYYNVQRKVEAGQWVLDAGLMEHALLNLMSNARKFSMSGVGVGVRKIRKAGTVATEELELWVWNDGAVINSADRAEIFMPGIQTSEGKKAGGHGLGLYIVKAIAERHHGRVNVESHEKVGTTFRIFLPVLVADNLPILPPDRSAVPLSDNPSELLKLG